MLPSQHRLKRSSDIKLVRRHGQSWRHPLVVLAVRANEQKTSRFAFVASRSVGNAVIRNRMKRQLREVVRVRLPYIAAGWDCLLIARTGLSQASFSDIETAVCQLLIRAQLLPQ